MRHSVVCVLPALLFYCVSAWADPDLGFENDSLGSQPAGWQIDAADGVVVTATEGASQFPVYAELGVEVEPNIGQQMARLGTPKQGNESQNRGANRISQIFASHQASLTFALRVFSLDHRGDDFVNISVNDPLSGHTFAVTGADNQPFTLDMPRGPDPVCAATPCHLTLDVGRRQDRLDSGWQTITISGLPTDGRSITLSINLEGGQNEAHPSWMYVDNVNNPPAATMNFNPGSAPGTVAQEGDFIVFDCLDAIDADGDDVTCEWLASGAGLAPTTASGKTAIFVFPQQGSASVSLTVSDGIESVTTTTGDGHSPALTISNGAPVVSAVNVEVLPGGSVELTCRFADPGVDDVHTAAFNISAPLADEQLLEENVATLSSGYYRATLDASGLVPGQYPGTCQVTDDAGGTGSSDFVVSVLAPTTFAARVAANPGSTENAPLQNAGNRFLGAITSPDNIAIYELRLPNGAALPVGAEVNVMVDVPVDYDVALLSGNTDGSVTVAPWVSAPWVSAPWVSAPWISVPFVSAPFISLPWVSLPFVSAPWVSAPWVSAPWVSAPLRTSPWVSANYQFQDFPLSQVGLAAPDGSQISGIDVAFEELGALAAGNLADEPVRVKALSAEFGTGQEHMLVKVGPGEQGLFLAVIPQAGSFSTTPFQAQVEVSVPPPAPQLLGEACTAEPLVAGATTTAEVLVGNSAPRSLVITQRERMMTTFNMDAAAYDAWLAELLAYFNHSDVQAKVISVPGTWFDTADSNPCVVSTQNEVAAQIKALIQAELAAAGGSIEYVQLMGSLDIVPPFYTPDETQTGYEGLYSADLWTKPGTPLSVAIAEGNNLTDAYYVDAAPQPFRGRALYTEDLSVSRLVETPAEIAANAARFVANNGIINLLSSQSTGYDFFIDGTEQVNQILSALPAPTQTLNNDTWNVNDLRCQFFGQGTDCQISQLNAVNAHMSYNGGVTATGFFSGDVAEIFAATEAGNQLLNGVTMSIGCHSGLSVPDAWALPTDVGLPLNPAQDWVQQLGTWVGSYTFAYGDSEVADRGTEGLMTLVMAKFASGETLGNALVQAKWQYGTGLYEFGVYDEKSMIALNVFGMPQSRLGSVSATVTPTGGNAVGDNTSSVGTAVLNITEQGQTTTSSYALEEQSNALGVWYTLDGNAQGSVGRPLQPATRVFETRVVPAGETTVHGVVLREGSYFEYLDQDPLLPVQQHDWVQSISEPTTCVDTMTPTQIAAVTRFNTPDETLQSLIVQPGQFQCTLPAHERGETATRGTHRIWDSADLELMHPLQLAFDSDAQPPIATRQDLLADPQTGTVTAVLDAADNLAMREIIALVHTDLDGLPGGQGIVTSHSTGDIQNIPGPHTLVLENAYQSRLAFQYVDVAGNVLTKSLKGSLLRGIEVAITTTVFSTQEVTTLKVFVEDFTSLQSPYMTTDFGDGSTPVLLELVQADGNPAGNVSVDSDGNAEITLQHDYAAFSGNTVTINTQVRAAGAQGHDEATLYSCSDPLGDALIADGDIIACGLSQTVNGRLAVDVYVAGMINPDISYRLRLAATNQQLKWTNGSISGPSKLKAEVSLLGGNGLRFTFRAAQAGWPGSGPFSFTLSTQDGVSGGASAGTVDETQVYSYEP